MAPKNEMSPMNKTFYNLEPKIRGQRFDSTKPAPGSSKTNGLLRVVDDTEYSKRLLDSLQLNCVEKYTCLLFAFSNCHSLKFFVF